jgi:glycosyltransferase involved in cell wall biosynthesis
VTDISVVFASGRPEAFEYPGGDTVQMRKTREALEERGVTVHTLERGKSLDDYRDADVLHVFNLPYSTRMLELVERGREHGFSIALSTVYWDFSHSLVLRTLSLRLRIDLRASLKPLVPAVYPLFHRVRSLLRSDSSFSLDRDRLGEIVDAVDVLLPNSEAELGKLADWVGRDARTLADKTRVVPSAIDRSLFGVDEDAARAARERYGVSDFVLEVGKLSPNKNQRSLIDAMEDVDRPLVIVGQGNSRYANDVKSLAKRDGIHYIEQIPHDELVELYNAAAVHALPSFRDSPGLVSLEAGACGCELIVSEPAYCPVDEYFGDTAYRCDPYDTASIEHAVRRALDGDRNDEAFRQRIRDEFTWDNAGEQTLAAYRRIV